MEHPTRAKRTDLDDAGDDWVVVHPPGKGITSIDIYKLLKKIHPDVGISSKCMSEIKSLLNTRLDEIAAEAGRQATVDGTDRMMPAHIKKAVETLFPGMLAERALQYAEESLVTYG
jgi:histone H2B